MGRINFLPATKKLVAQRAGFKCSFPGCGITTEGPDVKAQHGTSIGVASHIYSASDGGPRGKGALTKKELSSTSNCIWLCRSHGTLIDNNRGKGFPAETLLSYKALHESRISSEIYGIYPPVGWLHKIRIVRSPIFNSKAEITLAKLNLLTGNSGTGKTTLCEYLLGCFDEKHLWRWKDSNERIEAVFEFLMPNPVIVRMKMNNLGKVEYETNGVPCAFNPLPVKVLYLKNIEFNGSEKDDRKLIAEHIGLTVEEVERLSCEVGSFPFSHIHNLRFVTEVEDEDEDDHDDENESEENVEIRLYLDAEGTVADLPFRSLSGREKERVFIEFATAAARLYGKYGPTVLLIDTSLIIFNDWSDYFSRHLLDPQNQFQTIMCLVDNGHNLEATPWNGWVLLATQGEAPNVKLKTNNR